MCISLWSTVVHNTAQNSSDNFPSYPPDNHHCSDHVYCRGGGRFDRTPACDRQTDTETQQIPHYAHASSGKKRQVACIWPASVSEWRFLVVQSASCQYRKWRHSQTLRCWSSASVATSSPHVRHLSLTRRLSSSNTRARRKPTADKCEWKWRQMFCKVVQRRA